MMIQGGACKRGQSVDIGTRSFDVLNDTEQEVLKALFARGSADRPAMKNSDIQVVCLWESLKKGQASSRVRNSLRRLVASGWVEVPAKGSYRITEEGFSRMAPPPKALPAPREMSSQEARGLVLHTERALLVKKADCTFYNSCLDQAITGKWSGFSCVSCNAYDEPDAFVKSLNHVRLRALEMAADIMEECGGPCRVKGVKPGADAKRTVPTVVEDAPIVEIYADD